jgi:hypothetical protein
MSAESHMVRSKETHARTHAAKTQAKEEANINVRQARHALEERLQVWGERTSEDRSGVRIATSSKVVVPTGPGEATECASERMCCKETAGRAWDERDEWMTQ